MSALMKVNKSSGRGKKRRRGAMAKGRRGGRNAGMQILETRNPKKPQRVGQECLWGEGHSSINGFEPRRGRLEYNDYHHH